MYKDNIKIHYNLKYKPRDLQVDALESVKHSIRRGKKFMMLNMPVGTGKSFFSVMFMNWYRNYVNENAKFDILTNTKILQSQYTNEFPFFSSLKGKNSYKCNSYPGSTCQEGKEMNKALKRTCSDCPYDRDFAKWKMSDAAITNFHLFDTINLFLPEIMVAKEPNVLIIDEAHDFESVLCDFISMKITKRVLKSMGFSDTNIINISRELRSNVTSVSDFSDYVRDIFIPKLNSLKESLERRLSNGTIPETEKVKYVKSVTNLTGALFNYSSFIDDYTNNPNNWVMDTVFNKTDKQFTHDYTVQPVWSYKYLKETIWDKYDHVILMSGTILDKDMFSYINGLDVSRTSYFEVDTPFPLKNRPIYYIKAGKMTYNQKVETFQKQIGYIDKILKRNKGVKGIIHTGNYEIAGWLRDHYGEKGRMLFHTSDDRNEVLNKHIMSPEPTILVSPSMMNGIDLKDDLSRFQIILKIPYPNISSSKIKKRMSDNKQFYNWKTVVDFIQSYGRSVRSIEDHAETYVLDSSFSDVMQRNYKLIPKYILDAVKLINT